MTAFLTAMFYVCVVLIVLRVVTGESLRAVGPRRAQREAKHLCLLLRNADMRFTDAYSLYKTAVGALHLLYGNRVLDQMHAAADAAIPIWVERQLREQYGDEEIDRHIENHGPIG